MKTTFDFLKEKIQATTPTLSYNGENYDVWKIQARQKLSELLGMDKFDKVDAELEIEYTENIEGGTNTRFTFQSEEGYRIPCHILLPEGVKNPPVLICLQGHSPGMRISLAKYKNEAESPGERDFAVRAIKEGYAAIAIEQRNFGELSCDQGCYMPSMNSLILGRTTIGERVWDVQRLIDLIESSFADKIDTSLIGVIGNSGGGTATAYIAALEDRIKIAIPSCAMANYKDSIGAMQHCVCNFVPNIANFFDMDDLMAMACPKYYIQVSGVQDDIFPIFAARKVFEDGKKAYADNNVADRCAMVEGSEGHRFYADDTWPIIHKFLGR